MTKKKKKNSNYLRNQNINHVYFGKKKKKKINKQNFSTIILKKNYLFIFS
jgi:hypothetical protein